MTPSPRYGLFLEKLEEGLPGLTPAWGHFLAEASVVCLHWQKHTTGVELSLRGLESASLPVHWRYEVTEQLVRAFGDPEEATEYGACGVAILSILELTDYTVIRRSFKSTGVDYWLCKQEDLLFQDAARLEVSGILIGDNNTVRARLRKKEKQTTPTDGSLPVYIVVVEFGTPLSHMVKK